MKIKNMTAKEILEEVNKLEEKRRMDHDSEKFDIQGLEYLYKSYDLMKNFIENLHPGTRTL